MNTLSDKISNKAILAIIVPCYNEQEVIPNTIKKLSSLLKNMCDRDLISIDSYLLFVDDGSKDNTWNIITQAGNEYPVIHGIRLAHNMGHQNALIAGYEKVCNHCNIAITIDADLQDDETKIVEMVKHYSNGCDVVHGVRKSRKTDTIFKRSSAQAFYRFLKIMDVETVYNSADYRLLSTRAINQLLKYKETNMYLRGIVPTLGYKTACVYYDRKEREAGGSKYPISRMISLAFNGITSFSIRPVHIVMCLGILFILIASCILLWVLWCKFHGNTVVGWSSLIISIWFCSGCIITTIGIVGEYVGRTYMEVKQRPRYAICDEIN